MRQLIDIASNAILGSPSNLKGEFRIVIGVGEAIWCVLEGGFDGVGDDRVSAFVAVVVDEFISCSSADVEQRGLKFFLLFLVCEWCSAAAAADGICTIDVPTDGGVGDWLLLVVVFIFA